MRSAWRYPSLIKTQLAGSWIIADANMISVRHGLAQPSRYGREQMAVGEIPTPADQMYWERKDTYNFCNIHCWTKSGWKFIRVDVVVGGRVELGSLGQIANHLKLGRFTRSLILSIYWARGALEGAEDLLHHLLGEWTTHSLCSHLLLKVLINESSMSRIGNIVWKNDSSRESREIPHWETRVKLVYEVWMIIMKVELVKK